ncbi:hypothetical protein PCANC_17943 [Puccinia coronata f. sp. avenae]|uniref:Uncharacterized protein n=1 Tax=Puccinia coronata f. sp. avenae TaxID=200324 RepID=A0A2N5UR52_9BASI|nr:hypothetical protein PCANC_17943 [Puccinia coronata f. sp. avenae]
MASEATGKNTKQSYKQPISIDGHETNQDVISSISQKPPVANSIHSIYPSQGNNGQKMIQTAFIPDLAKVDGMDLTPNNRKKHQELTIQKPDASQPHQLPAQLHGTIEADIGVEQNQSIENDPRVDKANSVDE